MALKIPQNFKIRSATPTDASDLLEIYRPAVEGSAISFELTLPTAKEFAARIDSATTTHAWLVMHTDEHFCGYAYATPHRSRAAYQYAVETSVYVNVEFQGQGVGKQLYTALFNALQNKDFRNAYAGITMPNDASVALHASLGFKPIGHFREVGFKLAKWHDVSWWQRPIKKLS